ncbi:MAG: GNAT family N-acetyltransferase [Chloroflexota bacterium]|nr:GNAT family N-acetyltransferase [Chloroflexota bacterium]
MPVEVRPFRDADYPRYVEIGNAAYPEFPNSEAEVRRADTAWDHARFFKRRFVAEDGAGRVVGGGTIYHLPEQFHPDRYGLDVMVPPASRRQGIGSALYGRMLAELRGRGAAAVRAEAKASMPDGVDFLAHRGFVEVQWAWESRLDVAAFDPAPFAGAEARAADHGVAFTTLAAERARDPEALAKAHDLHLVCNRDVPEPDPVTDVPYEHFLGHEVEGPGALPDGYLLALDGDRYVAQSSLFASEENPDVLFQGLTGVRPEYRGKGIAMALKLRTVAYARAHGKREIRTWNNTRNRPMLRINEAMGFVKQPVWVVLQKDLTGDGTILAETEHGARG